MPSTERVPKPPWPLVATCTRGLEDVLAEELRSLGLGEAEIGRGSVRFAGDLRAVYRANLGLRTAIRVLLPLASGNATDRDSLYRLASTVGWERLTGPDQSLAVEAVGRTPELPHSGFAALVVKDAIVDRIRAHRRRRPNVDRADPDLRVHVHLGVDETAISLDSSGEPLSRRGYRLQGAEAPLTESLAAGLLLMAGYDGSRPFLDPMCGSGTLAAEAALIASRSAPGLERNFAAERWPFHDAGVLEDELRQARSRSRTPPAKIAANDIDPKTVAATKKNLRRAHMLRFVTVSRADIHDLDPPGPGSLIVTNPPYGHRLGELEKLRPLYRELGDALKQRAAGCTAWLLVGARELAKEIGLHASRRIVVFNGPIECRFFRYDLYAGSRRRQPPGEAGGSG
ncbi:MAG: THUMP domain-containing protein [Acidobacteria bacterium]|nr:THUMP domain-containing protein [Acidobacteriota bacterium]